MSGNGIVVFPFTDYTNTQISVHSAQIILSESFTGSTLVSGSKMRTYKKKKKNYSPKPSKIE